MASVARRGVVNVALDPVTLQQLDAAAALHNIKGGRPAVIRALLSGVNFSLDLVTLQRLEKAAALHNIEGGQPAVIRALLAAVGL